MWQDISTAPRDDGVVKLGTASSVSFTMVWHRAEWFAQFFPKMSESKTGAWVAHGYGLIAFTPLGLPQIVEPTKWHPIPPVEE